MHTQQPKKPLYNQFVDLIRSEKIRACEIPETQPSTLSNFPELRYKLALAETFRKNIQAVKYHARSQCHESSR